MGSPSLVLDTDSLQKIYHRYIIIVFLTALSTCLWAQIPANPAGTGSPTESLSVPDSSEYEFPDSLIAWRFAHLDFGDSLDLPKLDLYTQMRQIELARAGRHDMAHLGNLGSPLMPMAYSGVQELGLRTGVTGLESWIRGPRDLQFYRLNQAYSDFFFAQSGNQTNTRFDAKFSRDLVPNLNMSLEYRRINHTGFYDNQRNRHGSINLGLWYHSPDERWNSALIYSSNGLNEESNGGITTDTLFDVDNFDVRANIPVFLDRAGIIIQDRQLLWYTDYLLFGDDQQYLKLHYELQYDNRSLRFSDEDISGDDDFYGSLAVDERGLRNSFRVRRWHNELGLQTRIGRGSWRGNLKLGLRSILRLEDQEIMERTSTPIRLIGALNTQIGHGLELDSEAELILGDNLGRYRVAASLRGRLLDKFDLIAGLKSINYDPGWIYRSRILTGQLIYDQTLPNTQEDQLYGKLSLWDDKLAIGLHLYRIDNHSYFDDEFVAQTAESAILLQRIELDWALSWRSIHWSGSAFVQNYDRPLSGMPGQFVRTAVYYEGNWFRDELEVQIGLEARYTDRYLLPGWQPGIMAFYYQDTEFSRDYIPVDFFFQMKIDRFRAFVQMENASSIFSNKIYYTVAGYPMHESLIRFGFRWRLLN